jgi:hypothetical protein
MASRPAASDHRQLSKLVLSLYPMKILGFATTAASSRCGTTVIWSSPPMVARIARMLGSANAALMSAARSSELDPSLRVVGNSTGIKPVAAVSRRIACSCTAGAIPGAANDGERTATRSPAMSFGADKFSCE